MLKGARKVVIILETSQVYKQNSRITRRSKEDRVLRLKRMGSWHNEEFDEILNWVITEKKRVEK